MQSTHRETLLYQRDSTELARASRQGERRDKVDKGDKAQKVSELCFFLVSLSILVYSVYLLRGWLRIVEIDLGRRRHDERLRRGWASVGTFVLTESRRITRGGDRV